MADCTEHKTIPTLPSDPCGGKQIPTTCVFSQDAFTLLELPSGASLDVILNTLVTTLGVLNNMVNNQNAIIEDLTERIEILETP